MYVSKCLYIIMYACIQFVCTSLRLTPPKNKRVCSHVIVLMCFRPLVCAQDLINKTFSSVQFSCLFTEALKKTNKQPTLTGFHAPFPVCHLVLCLICHPVFCLVCHLVLCLVCHLICCLVLCLVCHLVYQLCDFAVPCFGAGKICTKRS